MTEPTRARLPRLLLVEDDELVRRCLERSLREVAEVCSASGGAGARALLRERSFEFVVSDLSLPDDDGLVLLSEAGALQPRARLVLLSGYEPSPAAREALAEGRLAAALCKPEGILELVRLVRQCEAGVEKA